MENLTNSLWIALGAGIGANARYWIGVLCRASTQSFPWPTLIINVVGSLLLGAFSAIALSRGVAVQWRLFFAVGVCGGFTTFSTFSFEVVSTFFERSWKLSLLYAVASLVLCVTFCLLGGHFGRILSQGPTSPNPFSK